MAVVVVAVVALVALVTDNIKWARVAIMAGYKDRTSAG